MTALAFFNLGKNIKAREQNCNVLSESLHCGTIYSQNVPSKYRSINSQAWVKAEVLRLRLQHTLKVGIVQRCSQHTAECCEVTVWAWAPWEMLGIFVENSAHICTSATKGNQCEASASLLQAPASPLASLWFIFYALYIAEYGSIVLSRHEKMLCLTKNWKRQ